MVNIPDTETLKKEFQNIYDSLEAKIQALVDQLQKDLMRIPGQTPGSLQALPWLGRGIKGIWRKLWHGDTPENPDWWYGHHGTATPTPAVKTPSALAGGTPASAGSTAPRTESYDKYRVGSRILLPLTEYHEMRLTVETAIDEEVGRFFVEANLPTKIVELLNTFKQQVSDVIRTHFNATWDLIVNGDLFSPPDEMFAIRNKAQAGAEPGQPRTRRGLGSKTPGDQTVAGDVSSPGGDTSGGTGGAASGVAGGAQPAASVDPNVASGKTPAHSPAAQPAPQGTGPGTPPGDEDAATQQAREAMAKQQQQPALAAVEGAWTGGRWFGKKVNEQGKPAGKIYYPTTNPAHLGELLTHLGQVGIDANDDMAVIKYAQLQITREREKAPDSNIEDFEQSGAHIPTVEFDTNVTLFDQGLSGYAFNYSARKALANKLYEPGAICPQAGGKYVAAQFMVKRPSKTKGPKSGQGLKQGNYFALYNHNTGKLAKQGDADAITDLIKLMVQNNVNPFDAYNAHAFIMSNKFTMQLPPPLVGQVGGEHFTHTSPMVVWVKTSLGHPASMAVNRGKIGAALILFTERELMPLGYRGIDHLFNWNHTDIWPTPEAAQRLMMLAKFHWEADPKKGEFSLDKINAAVQSLMAMHGLDAQKYTGEAMKQFLGGNNYDLALKKTAEKFAATGAIPTEPEKIKSHGEFQAAYERPTFTDYVTSIHPDSAVAQEMLQSRWVKTHHPGMAKQQKSENPESSESPKKSESPPEDASAQTAARKGAGIEIPDDEDPLVRKRTGRSLDDLTNLINAADEEDEDEDEDEDAEGQGGDSTQDDFAVPDVSASIEDEKAAADKAAADKAAADKAAADKAAADKAAAEAEPEAEPEPEPEAEPEEAESEADAESDAEPEEAEGEAEPEPEPEEGEGEGDEEAEATKKKQPPKPTGPRLADPFEDA